MADHKLFHRQSALIGMNVTWLRQAQTMLDEIGDARFTASPAGLAPHRVSGHLRHIIEFYECFLDGLTSAHVDYDARRRDSLLERSRLAASQRLDAIIERLTLDPELRGDAVLFVRMEDASALDLPEPYLMSSVGRELQSLSSHTIHHFALIAMTLRALGHSLDENFGVAPSTLRHRAEAA